MESGGAHLHSSRGDHVSIMKFGYLPLRRDRCAVHANLAAIIESDIPGEGRDLVHGAVDHNEHRLGAWARDRRSAQAENGCGCD